MKRRIVLGFLAAFVLIAILVGIVGSEEVVRELADVDTPLFALGFLSVALSLSWRTLVWIRVLSLVEEGFDRLRIARLFLASMGIMYVTPYGLVTTEPFVAYLVSRDGNMDYEDSLAGIVMADYLNYVPYYTLGFAALFVLGLQGAVEADATTYLAVAGGLAMALVGGTVVVLYRRALVARLVLGFGAAVRRTIGRVSGRVRELAGAAHLRTKLDGFYETVDLVARNRRTVAIAAVYAHLGMIFLILPIYLTTLAIGETVALLVVPVIVMVSKVGTAFPAPGGLGGIEAAVAAGLVVLGGVDPAAAVAVTLLYRICTYWFTVGVGGLAAIQLSVDWSVGN